MTEELQQDRRLEKIADAMRLLLRTERIVRTYPSDHQMSQRAIAELEPRLREVLPLDLQVQPDQLVSNDTPLLDRKHPSDLPTRLYRDGIRRLQLAEGIDSAELRRFVAALAVIIRPDDLSEDYVTQLWEANLPHVQVTAIDPYLDLDVPDEVLEGQQTPTAEKEGLRAVSDDTLPPPPEEAFRIGPEEAERIAREVEMARDAPPWGNFLTALFDTLEPKTGAERVKQVVELVEETFHRLLIEHRVEMAGELLERMNGRLPGIAERSVHEALHRIAHPERLAPLHHSLEVGDCAPEAAERLLLLLGDRAVESICALLASAREERVRRFYAGLLVKMGYSSVEPAVAHLRSTNLDARIEFSRVLGLLGDPRATPALAGLLSEEEPALRREAVRSLARIGGAPAISAIFTLALKDSDPSVRVVALLCLARCRTPLDFRATLARIESPELRSASDQEKDLLFQVLATSGDEEVIRYLHRCLQPGWIPRRTVPESWPRAAAALAGIGSRRAIALLEQLANSRNRDLARICQDALRSAPAEPR
jgi:hypothetical protein